MEVVSGLAEIIFYVVIFFVIGSSIKKKKRDSLERSQARREQEFRPAQAEPTRNADGASRSMTAQVNGKKAQNTADRSVVSSSVQVEEASGAQTSTTDYLAEKARQDQIEHAREKREEIKRLSKKSGGLFPAERLYDGDPVPAGKHCVICGYCAAENLIPNGSERKYSCYFCREPL